MPIYLRGIKKYFLVNSTGRVEKLFASGVWWCAWDAFRKWKSPPCFHTSRGVTQPIRREIPHKLDTSTRWEWSAVAGKRRKRHAYIGAG
jgi:hypothetical protein